MDYYIGYFPELKDKSYMEQFELLSKAKHEAFNVIGLRGKKYLRTFLIILASLFIGILPIALFDLNLFFRTLLFFLTIFSCNYFERKNYAHILHQGLVKVLSNDLQQVK